MKNAFFIKKCYEFVKEQLMKPTYSSSYKLHFTFHNFRQRLLQERTYFKSCFG